MLLCKPRRPAATGDQLFVRLRCRRAALRSGAPPGWQPADTPWRAWRRELSWVYQHLPPGLRRELEPVFAREELRQLLQGLRFLAASDPSAARHSVSESLLAAELTQLLANAPDVESALRRLDQLPLRAALVTEPLLGIYRDQGPGGVEQALLGGLLQRGSRQGRTAGVRGYFRYLIDMRNLLGIDRHLRWRLAQPPAWLDGGSLGPQRLSRLWQQRNPQQLEEAVTRLAGPEAGSAGDPEARLWAGLGHRLRAAGRDPLSSDLVLDYLVAWQLLLRQATTAG